MFSVFDLEVKQVRTTAHIIDAVEKLIKNMIPEIPISFVNAWESKSIFTIWRKSRRVFFYQSRQKNIVIDSNVNEVLERTLVAHELGHAVLHAQIAMMKGFQEMEVLYWSIQCISGSQIS